jgi:predicted O-linked N-acetylglucosamine transferase (SPINDLY family)
MISNDIKLRIEELFSQKKYEEVVKIVDESIETKDIPPGLFSLIGTCKILKKNRSEEELFSALDDFEKAYLKGNKSTQSLAGFSNFTLVCLKNIKINKQISPYLRKAKKYYYELEKIYEKNENFLTISLQLFSYFLDSNKEQDILEKLLSLNNKNKINISKYLFLSNYSYKWSQEEYLTQILKYSEFFPKYGVKKISRINYKNNKKINIGFLGKDFNKNHAITFFIKDLIKKLDTKKFQVHIFSVLKNLQIDKELEINSVKIYHVANLNNQELINLIQEKKIEILFDIMGYTWAERIEILNSRVSPIQISWLAYLNSIGFKNIDYMIADENLIKKDEEKFYSEKVIKLPEIWNAHSGFSHKRNFNKLPSLKNKHFHFGSFNNFKKISNEVVETWSKILKKVDNSKLILKSSQISDNEIIMNKFEKFKAHNQVTILNRSDFTDNLSHLKSYNNIDLAFDTFPYNGVTTTFEALWMNVPVLVLQGNNFLSRCGESIIKNANLNELIAKDRDDYVRKAIQLAENKDKLINIRENIYNKILGTPLFDTNKFTKNFSQILCNLREIAKYE